MRANCFLFVLCCLHLDSLCSNATSDSSTPGSECGGDNTGSTGPVTYCNIGFLGVGYDIFQGNPRATGGKPDPGYKEQRVFDLTYNLNNLTPDRRHRIPDNTSIIVSTDCQLDFKTDTIHDSESYQHSLREDVTASFSGFGASFRGSSDYTSVSQHTEDHTEQYYSTVANCIAYQAALYPFATKLSDPFISYVKRLPSTAVLGKDDISYSDFINTFGTHYVRQVNMGGRYGMQSRFGASSVVSMVTSQLNVNMMAKYAATVSIGASSDTSINKTLVTKFQDTRLNVEYFTSGGDPPAKATDFNAAQWFELVNKNPRPITYHLGTLSSLLSEVNFPEVENIAAKQSFLSAAISEYCNSLGLLYCDVDSPNPLSQTPNILISQHRQAVAFPPTGSSFFWNPIFNSSSFKALGTMLSCRGYPPKSQPVLALEGNNKSSDVVREAVSWTSHRVCHKYRYQSVLRTKCFVVKRPICNEDFLSLGDFAIEENDELPPNLPCIANQCVVPCSRAQCKLGPAFQGITNGYSPFGQNCDETMLSFFRYDTSNPQYYNCLTTACLQNY